LKDPAITLRDGFTLFELIVVLVIISAMITVIVPYAGRSNESLKIKEECLNMAEAVKYAIDLATDTKRATRIVINPKNRSYLLETTAGGADNQDYKPVEGFQGAVRYFGLKIYIADMDGFGVEGDDRYLTFDPEKPWPNASFSLLTNDAVNTIKIRGKQVEFEVSGI